MSRIATTAAALLLTAGCAGMTSQSEDNALTSPPARASAPLAASVPPSSLPSSKAASAAPSATTAPTDAPEGPELTVGGSGDLSTWTPWPNGDEPPLSPTTCGKTSAHYDGKPFEPAAMGCFAHAVTHCRSGSVALTLFGVDSGEHMVATLQPGTSPCTATVVATDWTANDGGYTSPATTLYCTVTARAAAVRLSCPHQTADWPLK